MENGTTRLSRPYARDRADIGHLGVSRDALETHHRSWFGQKEFCSQLHTKRDKTPRSAKKTPTRAAARLIVLRLPAHDDHADDYSRFRRHWLLVGAQGEVEPGDVVQCPELLTGAGEFEGLRFVGPSDEEGRLPLLPGGVEAPVFPKAIIDMLGGEVVAAELRARYEEALEASLHMQRGMSLGDIFGGNAEEFWASPDVQQKEPQLEGEYVIPFVSWPV